ncbi:MAG: hypothetical protein J5689_02765 [Clostridia bacterium]|nr:hypothetical protein [Clostridia bacterium]
MKLHNKYEIICGGKTIVGYNTMLTTVFDKIKNLEPYNGYFAFGTGTTLASASDTHLASYVATYANTTESVQPDVLQGDLYVTKIKVFDNNEANGLTFSEIGITDSSSSNPTVYNRVVLTDDEDNVISVTKPAGEEMIVKLTIYLEVSSDSSAKLIGGNNTLVKQILGEDASVSRALVFTKGNNLSSNTSIYRGVPNNYSSCQYEVLSYNLANDSGFALEFTIDFGTGNLVEVVGILDNCPVLRFNCLGSRASVTTTETIAKEGNNSAFVSGFVKNILSVTDTVTQQQVPYSVSLVANEFSDFKISPFSYPFTNQTPRFVSRDGSYIGFVLNGSFYLFKNEDYMLTEINTSIINIENYTNIIIVDNYVFVVKSNVTLAYRVANGALANMVITLNSNTINDYDFDLTDFGITISSNNTFMFYGIDDDGYGVCYIGSLNGTSNIEITSMSKTTKYGYTNAVSSFKNNFCDSAVYFLTTSYDDNTGLSYVESIISTGVVISNNTHAMAYDLLTNATSVSATSRVIYSRRNASGNNSIFNTYYLPEQRRYSIPYEGEVDIYFSPDFNYIIKKYSSTSYKIYNLIGYSIPIEFNSGIFNTLSAQTFTDFQFLKDTLLIFTSDQNSPIIAINLNKNCAVIENLNDSVSSNISVSVERYNVLGSITNENVEGKLTLKISGF